MAWLLIGTAAVLEVVWAVALKQSDGLSRLGPALLGATTAAASLVLLTAAPAVAPGRHGLRGMDRPRRPRRRPRAIVALGEATSMARLACLALIVSGVVGLRFAEAEAFRPPDRYTRTPRA